MSTPETSANVPYVIEQSLNGERAYDIWSRLLKDRIIFLGTPIDDYIANVIIAQFLLLEKQSPTEGIDFYINSPGGSVSAGLAIYDTIKLMKPKVSTFCIGQCCSMASVLLSGGTPGNRYCLNHARVMIHQVSGGARGQLTDMKIAVLEAERYMQDLMQILSANTGKDIETVTKDCDRDYFMTSEEALAYGIIDRVLVPGERP